MGGEDKIHTHHHQKRTITPIAVKEDLNISNNINSTPHPLLARRRQSLIEKCRKSLKVVSVNGEISKNAHNNEIVRHEELLISKNAESSINQMRKRRGLAWHH